ncbi:PorV/PorQ family protein [candidate division KSB1 bacterium]|nr:PorV/PorQ family protein [candidate division KSB1 bacterium]
MAVRDAQAVSEAGVIFLLIAPGARPAGMGEAFVAVADDATATWWNPAGLGFQRGFELTLMHSNWLPQFHMPDLYYDFISYRQEVTELGTVGLNVIFINYGETMHTDEHGNELGTIHSYDAAITGSYSSMLSMDFSIGVNLKFIYSHLSEIGAGEERGSGIGSSFAVDVGLLRRNLFFRGLSFGANLSNMGPKISYIDVAQADPLPTNLKMGLAYKLLDGEYNKITLSTDVNKLMVVRHKNGSTDPFYQALVTAWFGEWLTKNVISNVGVEYWYSDLVGLRAGYWHDPDGKIFSTTFGASLKYANYKFDFGYLTAGQGHPVTDTMRFSLTFSF